MSLTLAAHEQPLSHIFCNDYVFSIPPYQRPYAWTTEEAGELFSDLVDFMNTQGVGDVEALPPYFLGSIVLIKTTGSPNADVVDGQQRLTTLTVLLSAIRANVEATSGNVITQLIYERGSPTRKKNSSASNYDFARKKAAYFTKGGISPFTLTTQVLQPAEWRPEIVSARQTTLIERLETHWRLTDRHTKTLGQESSLANGDSLWRADVLAALHEIGRPASLKDIYRAVETRRQAAGRSVPKSIEAIVRRTLEENSSDSESFKGKADLFQLAAKGSGVWQLR